MIRRKFSQKNPWSFSQWWRFVCSATVPPSMASGAAARTTDLQPGSVSRAQYCNLKNSGTLFFPRNRCLESSVSLLVQFQLDKRFAFFFFLLENLNCFTCSHVCVCACAAKIFAWWRKENIGFRICAWGVITERLSTGVCLSQVILLEHVNSLSFA